MNVQTRLEDMAANDGDADLGIRYGAGNWPPDAVTELYAEWIQPVAAPAYLAAGHDPAELGRMTLLHPLPDRKDWLTWADKAGQPLDMRAGLDFDALDMALSAAEAGWASP